MNEKTCKICGLSKTIEDFKKEKSGYIRPTCKKCTDSRSNLITKNRRKNDEKFRNEWNSYLKSYNNKNPRRKSLRYLSNYNFMDKKINESNDLTVEFIESIIIQPCLYCGETEKIGLDRLDNNKGHLQSNVVPCCLRCNLIKGTMPYEAWQNLVPAIKDTKDKGLFGLWNGKNKL